MPVGATINVVPFSRSKILQCQMTKWEINDHTIYWHKRNQDGFLKLYINKEISMTLVSRATLLIDANSPWRVLKPP